VETYSSKRRRRKMISYVFMFGTILCLFIAIWKIWRNLKDAIDDLYDRLNCRIQSVGVEECKTMLDYIVGKDGMMCEYNSHFNRYQMNVSKDGWSFENARKQNNKKEQMFASVLRTNELLEKIKEQLDNQQKEEAKKNMKCCKCGKKIDYPATYIKMENATDKNLNKILAVCHDCAYWMISKGDEIDPILLKEN
jgi:hypothetical protein